MLLKKHRLKNKCFKNTFINGTTKYSENFIFKRLKNNLIYSRFGVAVGIKISKKAHIRNKIKRQINEVIRLNLYSLPIGFDYVIIVKNKKFKEVVRFKFLEIKNEILSIFSN